MFDTTVKFIKFNNFGTRHLNGPRHLFLSFCCTTQRIFEPLRVFEPGFNMHKYGTLLAIFNKPHVINILRTVRSPFTVIHMTLATYTKLEWLNVYRLTVTQCWARSGSTQMYHCVQTNCYDFIPSFLIVLWK